MTIFTDMTRVFPIVRNWLLTVICLATSVAGFAAMNPPAEGDKEFTAVKVFAEAPLEVIDMLRPSTRLDMLDYYTQADSLVIVSNALGGESRILEVAPDYMKVSVTPVSTLEIKILPYGKGNVVMTLYTVGDDSMATDTEVRFFDSLLNQLDASKFLKAPALVDFFSLKGSNMSEKELKEKIPYMAVEYSAGPGETPLTATLTTLRVVAEEDRDLLSPKLIASLSSDWKGRFSFK